MVKIQLAPSQAQPKLMLNFIHYHHLSHHGHLFKTDSSVNRHLELVPAFFDSLFIRQTSLLHGHLVLVPKVSILERVESIYIVHFTQAPKGRGGSLQTPELHVLHKYLVARDLNG